jgi:hypothetical protein
MLWMGNRISLLIFLSVTILQLEEREGRSRQIIGMYLDAASVGASSAEPKSPGAPQDSDPLDSINYPSSIGSTAISLHPGHERGNTASRYTPIGFKKGGVPAQGGECHRMCLLDRKQH